jgi:hypothetical protein
VPARLPLHNLTPPLQADQRQTWLSHGRPGTRQFVMKARNQEQQVAFRWRGEQREQKSVWISTPRQGGEIRGRGEAFGHRAQMATSSGPRKLDAPSTRP